MPAGTIAPKPQVKAGVTADSGRSSRGDGCARPRGHVRVASNELRVTSNGWLASGFSLGFHPDSGRLLTSP